MHTRVHVVRCPRMRPCPCARTRTRTRAQESSYMRTLRMPPLTGRGGGSALPRLPQRPSFSFHPTALTAPALPEEVLAPRPFSAGRPEFDGGGASLPAPRSPTLSGQGTRQPRPDRCSSRKGWGPLLGGSPPGSWAPACVRLDPSARPTDAWWCLHAAIQSPRLAMHHVAEGAGEER